MASPTTVTQPASGSTVDSALQTAEVALQLEACTLSDTSDAATQALRANQSHARAGVAQHTQAFRDVHAKAQHAEKAADRRAAWARRDVQNRWIPVETRVFLEAQPHRWAADLLERIAEDAVKYAEMMAVLDDLQRQVDELARSVKTQNRGIEVLERKFNVTAFVEEGARGRADAQAIAAEREERVAALEIGGVKAA